MSRWYTRGLTDVALAALVSSSPSWVAPSPSAGGGQARCTGRRDIDPGDVALPPGFRIEAVARDLTFPTSVTFDDRGRVYVLEAGYAYGEKWTTPRLLRV